VAKSDPADSVWRKSVASGNSGCVEVALLEESVLVRHSKDRSGSVLTFTRAEWAAFVAGVRNGEFEDGPSGTSSATSA
jgi:hypothetical protein